jgi:hypothetical protein
MHEVLVVHVRLFEHTGSFGKLFGGNTQVTEDFVRKTFREFTVESL